MGEETGGQIGPQNGPQGSQTLEYTYDYKQQGPFIVIVESVDKNLGNIHPAAIGKKFMTHKIKDLIKINRKGRNRISVEFTTAVGANSFIKNKIIKEEGLKAYIPAALATCRGIVRGIFQGISMEEFKKEAQSEVEIIDAKRMKKRETSDNGDVNYVDSEDIIITFKGTNYPSIVRIYYFEAKVSMYVPSPMQCTNCLRYGHLAKQCRGKARCPRCGDHEKTKCTVPQTDISCIYCNDPHEATNKKLCKEFNRQKNIRKTMVFNNLSYYEARKLHPKNENSTTNQPRNEPFIHLRQARIGQSGNRAKPEGPRQFGPLGRVVHTLKIQKYFTALKKNEYIEKILHNSLLQYYVSLCNIFPDIFPFKSLLWKYGIIM